MAYSDFKLNELVKKFELTLRETADLFGEVPDAAPSEHLALTLKRNLNLAVAINTEKARSEMIIAPILLEVKQRFADEVSLFSGVDFTVDTEKGLGGVCDFLISRSPEQLFVQAPVLTLVEAKNENLKSGFAQCIAEMLAAQLFNQREGNEIDIIYGAVTIGTLWRFLKLSGQIVELDLTEYFIKDVSKILGILFSMVSSL
ncbi:MAG: hypothetical protein ACFB8W_20250 [Elainellaceae cyanobacterium]